MRTNTKTIIMLRVIKLRDTYLFCTTCRAKLRQQHDHKECTSCDKRYYFNAKPAAGLLLMNDRDELLLVKRAQDPFKDWWGLPGGFVNEDETLEQAALRELQEETGLEAIDLRYVGSIATDYHFMGEIVPVTAAIFTAAVVDEDRLRAGDDASACLFTPLSEINIKHIAFESQQKFLENWLQTQRATQTLV